LPPWSTLESAPKRRTADNWHFLHDNEAGALQMVDKALRYDLGHDLISVVDALATLNRSVKASALAKSASAGVSLSASGIAS
jgi:hypothetical protein